MWGPTRQGISGSAWSRFQSTAPVWGPTIDLGLCAAVACISIHGPRVGADHMDTNKVLAVVISIHGPRVGADAFMARDSSRSWIFQSTAPVWGPTE